MTEGESQWERQQAGLANELKALGWKAVITTHGHGYVRITFRPQNAEPGAVDLEVTGHDFPSARMNVLQAIYAAEPKTEILS